MLSVGLCLLLFVYTNWVINALNFPAARIGVTFSPGGLLSPFHFGVAEQLRLCGVIDDSTALAGSSGGSLAAVGAGLKTDSIQLLQLSGKMSKWCRDKGTRNVLKLALEDALETALPDNAAEKLRERSAPCIVAYTEVNPFVKARHVSDFADKNDIIDCLRASCNVPFFFDGNKARVPVRGSYGIDGFFSTSVNRFGCPPTGATQLEILVTPYSAKMIGLSPHLTRPAGSLCKYAIISPDLLESSHWGYGLYDILHMSLNAPRAVLGGVVSDAEVDTTYARLFKAGREAVRLWYTQNSELVHASQTT